MLLVVGVKREAHSSTVENIAPVRGRGCFEFVGIGWVKDVVIGTVG